MTHPMALFSFYYVYIGLVRNQESGILKYQAAQVCILLCEQEELNELCKPVYDKIID